MEAKLRRFLYYFHILESREPIAVKHTMIHCDECMEENLFPRRAIVVVEWKVQERALSGKAPRNLLVR